MNIIEKYLDKITPKIEVKDKVEINQNNVSEFPHFIIATLDPKYHKTLQIKSNVILLKVKGRTISPVDLSAVLKNAPQLKKMNRMKSKIMIELQDTSLMISSYEHVLGTKKEKELIKKILTIRLESFIQTLKQ